MSVRVLVGDCIERLRELASDSVHAVVTSPPYWGLRDYGTGTWEGGEAGCEHLAPLGGGFAATGLQRDGRSEEARQGNAERIVANRQQHYRDLCAKCGARRIDQQIGLEPTPDAWAARLVEVFREVKRVLRPDGVCFVNIGDSYCSTPNGRSAADVKALGNDDRTFRDKPVGIPAGYKAKDLVGQPWLLAFALRADGWWLRSEIIWAKPNPMPESVNDRPTKAHETVFLLTKSARYFWDAEAVREGVTGGAHARRADGEWFYAKGEEGQNNRPGTWQDSYIPSSRNLRSVWTIATEPFPEAHFATFPTELPRRCILAGTSAKGCCPACGAPWARVMASGTPLTNGERNRGGRTDGYTTPKGGAAEWAQHVPPTTTGWRPSCACAAGEPVPCTVLDPFGGSGTTGVVADELGRDAILCELSPDYAAMAERRVVKARARRLLGPDAPRHDVLPGQLDLLANPHP